MRNLFDRSLHYLDDMLVDMGGRVDDLIAGTKTALKTQDRAKAKEIVQSDDEIDNMYHEIEQMCLTLITRQQPLARDLRIITAVLKIITDIERIADQCSDICEILLKNEVAPGLPGLASLSKMLEQAHSMFTKVMTAYTGRDAELARQVAADDDAVDAMFEQTVLEVTGSMSAGHPRERVLPMANLLFIDKYIERMADHTTNIGEWVIYMVEAVHPDLNPHQAKIGK